MQCGNLPERVFNVVICNRLYIEAFLISIFFIFVARFIPTGGMYYLILSFPHSCIRQSTELRKKNKEKLNFLLNTQS